MELTTQDILRGLSLLEPSAFQPSAHIETISQAVAHGDISLVLERATDYSFDALCGECFTAKNNPTLSPDSLKINKANFLIKVHNEGVFCLKARYQQGRQWADIDTAKTPLFVGKDACGSGFDYDLLNDALQAYQSFHQLQAA